MELKSQLVTPDVAKHYLTFNHNNRRINSNRVSHYADQMKKGLWKNDGSPIRLSSSPYSLLDGQHRLKAIIDSGCPQDMIVISDLPHSTFSTIDTGKLRNANDSFNIAGVPNPAAASAATSFILNFQMFNGNPSPGKLRNKNNKMYNNEELLNAYQLMSGLEGYVSEGLKMYRSFRFLRPAIFIGMYYILSNIEANAAKSFFTKLSSGENLSSDSPVYVLRKKLIDNSVSAAKLTEENKVALLITAWNLFRTHKRSTQLRWNRESSPFPLPL